MTVRSGMVQFHEGVADKLQPIDSIKPYPSNYNNGDIEAIMDSILANGMYRPVYVQRSTGYIVAGNHTWMACKELDAAEIPVVFLDLSDMATARIAIGDNEIARKSRPDTGQLVELLEILQADDGGLLGTGINDQELRQLQELNDIPLDPDDGSHRSWPTLCFQVPPHVKRKFYDMTEVAGGDTERFKLMLKLAGWDGRK